MFDLFLLRLQIYFVQFEDVTSLLLTGKLAKEHRDEGEEDAVDSPERKASANSFCSLHKTLSTRPKPISHPSLVLETSN